MAYVVGLSMFHCQLLGLGLDKLPAIDMYSISIFLGYTCAGVTNVSVVLGWTAEAAAKINNIL